MSSSRARTIHAERGFRRPRRPGGTPAGRRGAPRAALRSDALSPRPWRLPVASKRFGSALGAQRDRAPERRRAMATPASEARFTRAERAGGLGGAPLAVASKHVIH